MKPLVLTRRDLHRHYASGLSPRVVLDACLTRIAESKNDGVFIHRPDAASILDAVDRLPPFDPERFPLWGLPFAVKDNIDVAGSPTTAACPAFSYKPDCSATVVEKLTAAGAIAIGKTNLDQFATGLVGVRSPYAIPLNPFDPACVPGGSSSGSAVAVASGFASFSLGTDTAGSGRIPAALNNLVGLKPSLGALSTRGVVPACRTLDCVSIFALTVEDARAVFDCAAGYDDADPYSRPLPEERPPPRRMGVPRPADLRFFGDTIMADAWSRAARILADLDLETVEIDMTPFFAVARLLYEGPWVAERRAAVGVLMDQRPEAIHPVIRQILESGDRHSAVDAFKAFYELAALRRACMKTLSNIDVLAVPTAPIFPTLADLTADPIGPNSRLGTYTNFVNLLDLAAIAVPGPFRRDGLPAGFTLIAPAGADRALCDLAGRLFPSIGGMPSLTYARAA